MRFARTTKAFLLALVLLSLGATPSSATEIPSLTWERGKTLNVVLGGYPENLGWKILLEGEEDPIEFSQSARSSTGFIVYSISLPRDLSLGQYQIVARGNQETVTKVAAVQVVERFQYDVLEIPRDFFFLLFALILFLSMQLTLRSWIRRESDGMGSDEPSTLAVDVSKPRSELVVALTSQRMRFKRSWVGTDFIPGDFKLNQGIANSILPLVALVSGLYCGVTGNLIPLQSVEGTALLALLGCIGIFDRYSAKLASIGFVSLYVLFNETLNFPTLLGIALLVLMFFLPQYVGDVTREFMVRESSTLSGRRELREGIASLAAGTSVFWLYLLSESLNKGDGTNSSKVTPIAIAVALSYFLRSSILTSNSIPRANPEFEGLTVRPILGLRSAILVSAFLASVVFVWTGEFVLASIAGLFMGGSLISINLLTNRTFRIRSQSMARASTQVGLLVLIEIALFLFVSRLPEVVMDRAKLMIFLVGLPIAALAMIQLFTSPLNSGLGTARREQDKSPLDSGSSK